MQGFAASRLVICIFTAVLQRSNGQATKGFMFQKVPDFDNYEPNPGDLVKTLTDVTLLSTCIERCLGSDRCISVFYDESHDRCLLMARQFTSTDGMSSAMGWQYWQVMCPAVEGYLYDTEFDICVRFVRHNNNSYNEAQSACKKDNSELINIDSMEKLLVLTHFPRNVTGKYRVAGQRPANGDVDEFVLDNGKRLPFEQNSLAWDPKQPNNLHGDQHCLTLKVNNVKLLDEECYAMTDEAGYICERRW